MDEKTVEVLARGAGLGKALHEFPDDLAAAASSAEKVTERVRATTTAPPTLEPWPPMVVVRT